MILEGKVALVTGSTSGIGLAIAKAFAAEGAKLMINGFGDPADIERECDELGAIHDGADLSDPAAIEAHAAALRGRARRARRAGQQCRHPARRAGRGFPAREMGRDHRHQPVGRVPHDAPRAAGHEGQGAGDGSSTPRSAHSLVASPNKSAYVAAKHGVAGFTKAVALEAARDGVTVNCISPGYVWTTLVENQIPDTMKARGLTREQVMNDVLLAAQPTKRFVTPEEVAALALFLCRDDAASITGANLSMDGGWTAA